MYFVYFSHLVVMLICNDPFQRDFIEKLHRNGFSTDIKCSNSNSWIKKVRVFFMQSSQEVYFYFDIDSSITTIVEDKVIKFCKIKNLNDCEAYGYNKNYEKTTLKGKTVNILAHEGKNILEVEKTIQGYQIKDTVYLSKFLLLLEETLEIKIKVMSISFFPSNIDFEIPYNRKPKNDPFKYSSPAINDGPPIYVIRAAQPLDKSRALIKPFSEMVWMGISISIPVVTLCLLGLSRIEAKLKKKKFPILSRIIWLTIDSILRQDTNIDSLAFTTVKIIMGIWLLMAFVLTSGYSSILPSFLIFPEKEVIPENFFELSQAVERGEYSIGSLQNSREFYLFLKAKTGSDSEWNYIIKTLSDSMLSDLIGNIAENETIALQKVLNGNFALITTERLIKPEIMKMGVDKFFISNDILFSSYDYIRMNGLNFKNIYDVNKMINIIHQTGILAKYYNDQLEQARRETEFYSFEDEDYEDQLRVEQIMGVLYISIIGYCSSSLIFLCELIVYACKKRTKKN